MPTSSNDLKNAIFEHIRTMVLEHLPQRYKILDVGPGIGTYGMNLSDLNIDAIEIYEPYVEQYGIRKYYGNVFIGDITEFEVDDYDYIIIGDVLEHLPIWKAQRLIQSITEKNIKCLVAVPYLCPQDAVDGVESEIHYQWDLTPRVMKSRYPELEIFLSTNHVNGYAYYTNYHTFNKF